MSGLPGYDRRLVLAGGSALLALGVAGASKALAFAREEVQSRVSSGATGNVLRPEMFGAAGNGRADDTAALSVFARALGGGVNGRMDGQYKISKAITFAGTRGFELHGSGTITVAGGTPTNELHSGLHFSSCSDFLVDGLTVDGNRGNRRTVEDSGHLIRLDSCHRATFRNVIAANGTTDGWFVAALATGNGPGGGPAESDIPSDLLFEDCVADGCYRNGLSIIDAYRLVVRGGSFSRNYGHYDDTGKGPCAGIDIEPNRGAGWIPNRVRDVLLDKVRFEGNQGFQLIVCEFEGVHEVVVRDCSFIGNRRGAVEISAAEVQFLRPRIVGFGDEDYTSHPSADAKRGVIDFPAFAKGGALVSNPAFHGITARRRDLSLIYSHGTCAGRNRIVGLEKDSDCALGVQLRAPGDMLTESAAL